MVLGDMSKLPDELAEDLNLSGVRHLTSISGTHVSILSSNLMSFLLGIGIWRKKAFWITIALISLFIIFTGLQPPAIRSGIMGACFLTSRYLGRQNSSLRAVVLSAGIMLFLNPLLLIFDIGFQLSFLAILGILLLTPIFEKWLHRLPKKFQIREITAMSLAAQIFTLPILVFNFGQFSLVAPIANLFIVPILPHIMILGFIFSFLGFLFVPLGFLLSIPCLLLLEYLIVSMGWFADLPFSALFFNISGSWVFVYYALLFVFVLFFTRKLKKYSF
jgi:competence protein ComEC